jgi:hypothetical protein
MYASTGDDQHQHQQMTLLDTTQLSADQGYFQDRANSMQFIESQLHKIDQVSHPLIVSLTGDQPSMRVCVCFVDDAADCWHDVFLCVMLYLLH